MKKISIFLKNNRKNIFIVIVFTLLIFFCGNFIFAAINSQSSEIDRGTLGQDILDNIQILINGLVSLVGNIASGTIGRLIATLITALSGIGFLLLYFVWTLCGGTVFNLPFPDRIVFNHMSFFDPNFINPTENLTAVAQKTNIMYFIGDVTSSLYFTFFIIAGLIMIVAAMIIGIRLAISSIAIEKAQYKELLNKWLIGIVVLFCLHFFILGVFTLNEQICEIADNISGDCTFTFDISGINIGTQVVSSIKGFFTGVGSLLSGEGWNPDTSLPIELQGYTGIIVYLLFSVILNGDIISSIALLALVGQTINLIFQYIKRFIFVIFLAIIAPLVVAVDIIKKAI